MLLVAWLLLSAFELLLCLRADSVIEWTWLQVFVPLFALDAFVVVWTIVGVATRSILEQRANFIAVVRVCCVVVACRRFNPAV